MEKEMTALERIKKIENSFYVPGSPQAIPQIDNVNENIEFLIKAFKVMKEIAIEYKEQTRYARGLKDKLDVDKEFELSMNMMAEK